MCVCSRLIGGSVLVLRPRQTTHSIVVAGLDHEPQLIHRPAAVDARHKAGQDDYADTVSSECFSALRIPQGSSASSTGQSPELLCPHLSPDLPADLDPAVLCRRRRITKREQVITQLVNKSAAADLRAIKQLTDIVQRVERRNEGSEAPSERAKLSAPDREVVELFIARLRRQIAAEAVEAAAAVAGDEEPG